MDEDVGTTAAPTPETDGGRTPAAEEPTPAQPAPVASERQGRSPLVLAGQIGGVVTTVATIVGLIFVFAPGLKPEPPAAEKGAVFSDITTDVNVSRGGYLRRLDRDAGGYTPEELRRLGVIVGFHVTMTGHKGEALPLRWGVYSAADGREVYREKVMTLTPEAPSDEASSQIWTPLPRGQGPYYVLLQLFEEDGLVTITQARSDRFDGLAERAEGRQ